MNAACESKGCPAGSGYPELCGSHPDHACFRSVPKYPYAKPPRDVADANFRLAYAAVQADQLMSEGKTVRGAAVLAAAVQEHSHALERFDVG